MKKTLLFITSFLMFLLVLMPSNSQAVLLEKTLDFNVISRQTQAGHDRRYVVNVGENLYSKLDEFLNWGTDFNNQGDPFYVTIKKGPLEYNARISHLYHIAWDIHRFTIGIEYTSNNWATYDIYPEDFTVPLSTPIQVNVGSALFSHGVGLDGITTGDMLGSYTIYAMLEGEVDTEDGIDVSNNFSLIPSTTGTLANASNTASVGYVYFIHNEDNLFDTYVILAGQTYILGTLELPGVTELNKLPLNPGIYWTENNKRNIYYEFQEPESVKPISEQFITFLDDPSQVKSFRPFVTMNLTDSTYTFTDKLTLYAGYYGGENGEAFADVVFPFELDQLLSITINYRYRWETLWGWPVIGGYGQWNDVIVNRYIDEVVDMRSTWQHVSSYLFGGVLGGVYSQLTGWNETIQQITANTLYKQDYTDNINIVRLAQGKTALTVNQIFPPGSDVYRVYLDTYNQPGYTGYQVDNNIIIMDVLYQVDGEIYFVPYTDITQGGSFGGGGPGLGGQDQNQWDWSFLTSFLSNIPTEYIFIGLLAIGVIFWKPIKRTLDNIQKLIKNPKDLVLLIVIIAAVMYFLGYL